jgi:hypothetical protein
LSAGYVPCDVTGIFSCVGNAAACAATGGNAIVCADSGALAAIKQGDCAQNCTCGNVTRGTCLTSGGISQCTCFDSYHGSDCCTAGGIPAALIGGIAAGVIAAIAIAGAILIFVVVVASKKAVDWAMLNNQSNAVSMENPTHIPANTDNYNPAWRFTQNLKN